MAYTQNVYSGDGITKGYKWARGVNATNSNNGSSGRYSPGGTGRNASTGNSRYSTNSSTNTTRRSGAGSNSIASSSAASAAATPAVDTSSSYDSSYSTEQAYEAPEVIDYSELANAYYDKLRGLANDAYARGQGIVNANYTNSLNNLNANYNASRAQMANSYNSNAKAINADAEKSMRQAYINNMLSRKALTQAMTAQGLNGGASETTRASLENNYGNARNAIDTTRNENLSNLSNNFMQNLLSLEQSMNSAKSDLDSQRLSYNLQVNDKVQDMLNNYVTMLYNDVTNKAGIEATGKVGTDALSLYNGDGGSAAMGQLANSYINQLNNLSSASKALNMTPTEAINAYNPATTTQAATDAGSNYARILAEQALQNPVANSTYSNYLTGNNQNVGSLAQILSQLY